MKRLTQRTAVVTGAASGIGRATALELADAGCHLALVDIDEAGLAESEQMVKRRGARTSCFAVDVGDAAAMEELAADVVEEFGEVHVVINNAGINVTASFEDHELEDFEKTFDVNFWGVVYGCRYFLPYLRQVDEAHIVNISSVFGIVGVAGQSAYSASKFAVRGLSESLHEELSDTSIGVTVVHPGCINTQIIHRARIADEELARRARAHFLSKGCRPEVVGQKIVAAVLADRHRLLVTPEAWVTDFLRRLIPTRGNRLANRMMARVLGVELY